MAKELKDYTREELEAEIVRRDALDAWGLKELAEKPEKHAKSWNEADVQQLLADLRWLRGHRDDSDCDRD